MKQRLPGSTLPMLTVAIDAVALMLLRNAPGRAVAVLGHLGTSTDAAGTDRAASALCAAGMFVAAAWLGLGLAAAATAALPGAAGRAAARASRLLLPAVIRRVLAGTLGFSVLLAPVAAGASNPGAHPRNAVAAYAGYIVSGMPRLADSAATGSGGATMPAPTWPTSPTDRPRSHVHERRTPGTDLDGSKGSIRVDTGDSLWLIAARRLGTDDGADIAEYWPRVYARNRSVVGDDPGLIRPGQRLTLPTPTVEESPS